MRDDPKLAVRNDVLRGRGMLRDVLLAELDAALQDLAGPNFLLVQGI
jgi:hypothetical protein